MSTEKTLAQHLHDRHEDMKNRRLLFENAIQEISDLFIPFRGDVTTKVTPGATRISSVLDSFGMEAADEFADFVHGNLFSGDWLKLAILDEKRQPNPKLQGVADVTARRILEELDESNFYTMAFEFIRDLCVLGTAIFRIEEDVDEGILRFLAVPWAQIWICENKKGEVEGVHWEFEMPAEEAVDRWGVKAGTQAQKLVDDGQGRERVKYLHCVFKRRKSMTWTMKAGTDKPWAGVTLVEEEGRHEIVEEDGFKIRPYIVGRWMKVAGEEWGRGCGHKARSDMKGANELKRQGLLAIPLAIRPPLFAEDGGLLNTQVLPHGIVSIKPGRKFPPEFAKVGADFEAADRIRREDHEQIGKAFLLDVLGEKDTEPRSAAETIARRGRALSRLSHPSARILREFLRPLIATIVDAMNEAGRLPELTELQKSTPEDQSADLDATFLSPLILAQREAALQGLNQTIVENLEMASATGDPQWLDAIHPDRTILYKRSQRSLPAEVFRTEDEIQQVREARAQMSAQAQAAAMAEQLSKASKNLQGARAA